MTSSPVIGMAGFHYSGNNNNNIYLTAIEFSPGDEA